MLSSVPAASTTTRAFTLISRRESRSTKVAAVGQPGILVHRKLAHHRIGNGGQLAGLLRIGQQKIHRAGQAVTPSARRCLHTGISSGLAAAMNRCIDSRPRIVVENEVAVRHLRRTVQRARDAKDLLHARVVGRQIGMADRPVFAEAVVRFALNS